MAPRKNTPQKTTTSKTQKTRVSKKAAKKTAPAKTSTGVASAIALPRIPFADKLKLSNYKNLPVSKNMYVIFGAVGLLLLLFAASRYLVVAWVDNRPITRIEFYGNLEKRFGKDIKEQMIVETIILNEAQKRGVNIADAELNSEIGKIKEQQGGEEQLNQILQLQGISQDEFKKLVKLQVLKQKMFGSDASVSEDELNKYIEDNKQQLISANSDSQSSEVSDEMKNNIREELKQQKVNENFNNWLQEALQGPRVKRV